MRRIQRDTRNKEEQKHEPVKAMWKSGKYENVESRVRGDLMVCVWLDYNYNKFLLGLS